MPVSGIVVTCAPDRVDEVAGALSAFDCIEVHGILATGKVVAVIEADSVDAEVSLVSLLHDVDGVTSVQMAYHNFEDA